MCSVRVVVLVCVVVWSLRVAVCLCCEVAVARVCDGVVCC